MPFDQVDAEQPAVVEPTAAARPPPAGLAQEVTVGVVEARKAILQPVGARPDPDFAGSGDTRGLLGHRHPVASDRADRREGFGRALGPQDKLGEHVAGQRHDQAPAEARGLEKKASAHAPERCAGLGRVVVEADDGQLDRPVDEHAALTAVENIEEAAGRVAEVDHRRGEHQRRRADTGIEPPLLRSEPREPAAVKAAGQGPKRGVVDPAREGAEVRCSSFVDKPSRGLGQRFHRLLRSTRTKRRPYDSLRAVRPGWK